MSSIRVIKFDPKERGQMIGLLEVEVDAVIDGDSFTIKLSAVKLMKKPSDGTLWIGLPSSQRFASGQSIYTNLINFGDRSQQDLFSAQVLDALDAFRGNQRPA